MVGAARDVLTRIEDLRHLAHAGEPGGLLRVGSIPSSLTGIVPKALRLMAARHPRVEIKMVPGTSPSSTGWWSEATSTAP